MRSVTHRERTWLLLKRLMDIVISATCLALLAPLFAAAAIAIWADSGRPVFFRQQRIGQHGRPFRIWKFRTMVQDAERLGLGTTVAQNDWRITRVGRILRDFGLDELPQLINVLRGEMSIVGPRPTVAYQVALYNNVQRQRLLARPGITSLAVVLGRNALTWEQRIRLDVFYVRHWSLWLDLRIILRTFWVVLVTRQGLYGKDGINDDFLPRPAAPTGQARD